MPFICQIRVNIVPVCGGSAPRLKPRATPTRAACAAYRVGPGSVASPGYTMLAHTQWLPQGQCPYPTRHTTFAPARRTANIPHESYPARLRRSLLEDRYTNRVPSRVPPR